MCSQGIGLLQAGAKRRGLTQIEARLGAVDDVIVPAASVDVAIMVDVHHALSQPRKVTTSVIKRLNPGGRVVFVEYKAEDPRVAIKPLHKMSETQIKREDALFALDWEHKVNALPGSTWWCSASGAEGRCLATDDPFNRMGDAMILSLAVLSTALLFGGMTLYSFGFAAFRFTALPAKTAGETLRRAFPWFYVFVIATSVAAALLWWPRNPVFAAVMAAVAITTVPGRQVLRPAITRPTDAGLRQRFKWLHGLSGVVTLGHIAATGWLLSNLA